MIARYVIKGYFRSGLFHDQSSNLSHEMSYVYFHLVFTVIFALTCLTTIANGQQRFDGYVVYRAVPSTREQLDFLKTIMSNAGAHDENSSILFWTEVGAVNNPVDIMVSPSAEADLLTSFAAAGISYTTFIEDVQTLIDNENPKSFSRADDDNDTMDWTAYHTLDVINDWLDELAESYPDLIKIIEYGTSYEGRVLKGIKITFDEDYPGIFIEGGLHAREWISPAVVTYLTNEILTTTSDVEKLFYHRHNWFIFPVTNPDGYVYSHTDNRMWRKTRQPYDNNCTGADPNRNWDYQWLANGGASDYSCDETYAGPEPFSEPEIKAFADYIASVSQDFYIYLSIHSYSQLILLPYGWTYDHLDNYDEAMLVGNKAAAALAKRYNTSFVVGSTAETIYVASGISTDYVKQLHGTPIVYCYELRDTGTYGFLLPAEQIIPSSLEFIDSLFALIGETRKLGYPVSHVGSPLEV